MDEKSGTGHDPAEATDPDVLPEDRSDVACDPDSTSGPVEVGDGRRKYVTVVTRRGTQTEHSEVYLKHSSEGFVVSPESSFAAAECTRYRKSDLLRVDVTQHHPACFITTAAAGDGPTLSALRGFRDDALARSQPGRALVAVYYALSPPIAATLAAHPDARTTRLVRRLVVVCGRLARRRAASRSRALRSGLSVSLVALYVLGVWCGALGHLLIRCRERAITS